MSMLLFYVGENCYAINCSNILRIVPKVNLKHIPYKVNYIAGILNLRGKAVPVIDFCQLIEQREAKFLLNSRIILVQDPRPKSEQVLGILGEKVDKIVDLRPEQFRQPEFSLPYFPYLDKIYSDNKGIVQYINIEEFFQHLSDEVFNEVGKEHE